MSLSARNHSLVLDMVYCALFAALMTVCSWIAIPTTIPFTMQTFAVCVTGALLGPRLGVMAVATHLLLGAVGLPVFAQFTGGLGILFGLTGGYLIGFLFTALTVGAATSRFGRSLPVMIVSMAAGILLCYAFGTAWFMIIYRTGEGPIGLTAALGMCVFPYLIPDAVKIILATIIVRRLERYVG